MKIPFLLAEEKSLIAELWEYFIEKYFTPDPVYLENFNGGTSRIVSLRLIIIGITVGFCVASILTLIDKKHLGGLVRHMLSEECIGKENAKTLEELGYSKSAAVRGSLRSGTVLKKWVRCVEEDIHRAEIEKKREEYEEETKNNPKAKPFREVEFKRDPDRHHFYIDEEKKYSAAVKFDSKGTNVVSAIMVMLISIIICALLCYVVPDMLTLFDNFVSGFKGNDKYL